MGLLENGLATEDDAACCHEVVCLDVDFLAEALDVDDGEVGCVVGVGPLVDEGFIAAGEVVEFCVGVAEEGFWELFCLDRGHVFEC